MRGHIQENLTPYLVFKIEVASEMSTEQNGNEFLIILGKVFWGAAQFPRYNLKESIPTK